MGQIASRDSFFSDEGQRPLNTGRPVKYGTSGKPTSSGSSRDSTCMRRPSSGTRAVGYP